MASADARGATASEARSAAGAPAYSETARGGTAVVFPMQRHKSLGDLVVQLPLLHALRTGLGAERVAVIGPHPFLETLRAIGAADSVDVIPDRAARRIRARLAELGPRWALTLRATSLRSTRYVRGCRGALRLGFDSLANRLLLDRTAAKRADTYYPFVLGRVLEPLGVAIDPPACIAALAGRQGAEAGGLLVIPAGNLPEKHWGHARYAELARRWSQERGGAPVRFVCGAQEAEALGAALAAAGGAWPVEVGPSLPRIAALARAARAVVANDCGPGHLAIMAGGPMVSLFHHAHGERAEREALIRLWWWDRPGAAALSTAAQAPLASVPVERVLEALRAVESEPQRAHGLRWL